jgi:glutamate-1-semialdehyde 2,1-aminomutase
MNPTRVASLLAREQQAFAARHPRSSALAAQASAHFPGGVPLHWMTDWGTPFPLFMRAAEGASLRCVDEHRYADFCLGDTGSMYGHSPPPVATAIAAQAARGLTSMLPGEALAEVGERLQSLFGLPSWQITLSASDANRAVLRWLRAVSGRTRILVFDGCYHCTVDETLVRAAPAGRARARPGLVGAPFDVAASTAVVPFNDLAQLERVLAAGDIAALLCEPVMTNIGMVLPDAGFLEAAFALARRHGTSVVLDETHTLSSGYGGYGRVHGLAVDALVCGKAIAGGIPCAVWGVSEALHRRIEQFKASRKGGHSGIGTTLAANPLSVVALLAALREVVTPDNHALMEQGALHLEQRLRQLFDRRALPWHVSRVGARVEFGFGPAPRDAARSEAQMQPELERVIHLCMLNRGFLMTPFHNMLLCSPVTAIPDIDSFAQHLHAVLEECGP